MSFGAHQSFYIRDGWLYKGMSTIQGDQELGVVPAPSIFTQPDSPQILGIGRNMVRSLRFWMQASGLTEEFTGSTGKREHRFTEFGELVWQHDPYLEDIGTLWLIHYHLICQPNLATTWYWFFNHFGQDKFTSQQVFEQLRAWVITFDEARETVSDKLLQKEFSTLINTYHQDGRQQSPENILTCPLADLYLLTHEQNHTYRFLLTSVNRVHPLVFLYVLLQESPNVPREVSQLSLTQALNDSMSVGRVFNLNTSSLIELLGRLKNHYPEYGIDFIRTSGLDLIRLARIEATPKRVLSRYYEDRL